MKNNFDKNSRAKYTLEFKDTLNKSTNSMCQAL